MNPNTYRFIFNAIYDSYTYAGYLPSTDQLKEYVMNTFNQDCSNISDIDLILKDFKNIHFGHL
jgi:hypothetical protein